MKRFKTSNSSWNWKEDDQLLEEFLEGNDSELPSVTPINNIKALENVNSLPPSPDGAAGGNFYSYSSSSYTTNTTNPNPFHTHSTPSTSGSIGNVTTPNFPQQYPPPLWMTEETSLNPQEREQAIEQMLGLMFHLEDALKEVDIDNISEFDTSLPLLIATLKLKGFEITIKPVK